LGFRQEAYCSPFPKGRSQETKLGIASPGFSRGVLTKKSRGWIKGQPLRFKHHHEIHGPGTAAEKRKVSRIRRGRAHDRKYRLKNWNFTSADYDAMLEKQDGRCAICKTDAPGGRWNRFYIDHDHACCQSNGSCGKCIRGLLCRRCNWSLGAIADRWDLAYALYEYLDKHIGIKEKAWQKSLLQR